MRNIQIESHNEVFIDKSGETIDTSIRTILAEIFQDEKLTFRQITSELAVKMPTLIQEQIYRTEIVAKDPFADPDLNIPSVAIKSKFTENWRSRLQATKYSIKNGVLELKNSLVNEINMRYFVESTLHCFGWDDLKKTSSGMEIDVSLTGCECTVINELWNIIGVAREYCELLCTSATSKLSSLKSPECTYNHGIAILYDIVSSFRKYFINALYLDDLFKHINDIVNEADSYSETHCFSIWSLLVDIYKAKCYKYIEKDLYEFFSGIVSQLLIAMLKSNIDEEKLNQLLIEENLLMLEEIGKFFVDMKVSQYNVSFLSKSNPKSRVGLDELVSTFNSFIKTLIDNSSENVTAFAKMIPIYIKFLRKLFIPQVSYRTFYSLYDSILKYEAKLDSATLESFRKEKERLSRFK